MSSPSLLGLASTLVLSLSPLDGAQTPARPAAAPGGELELSALCSDHAVLQRDGEVAISGRTAPGIEVLVTTGWNGAKLATRSDAQGAFAVRARTGAAGGPYTIEVEGGGHATVRDVLLGDVWLCSGQSNMEWPIAPVRGMSGIGDWQKVVAEADCPTLRLFDVPNVTAARPSASCAGAWRACTRENAGDFSATAYFFGRELARELGVPIGLVTSDWGGTPVQAWTSAGGLAAFARFASPLADLAKRRGTPDEPAVEPHAPSALYNGMIAPLLQLVPRGVIWYQGEANREDAGEYSAMFGALIEDWRKRFAAPELPFYFVQIAPYRYGDLPGRSAFVRDAQRRTLELAHTGMAVTLDIGDAEDIHPKEKRQVGRRLAQLALADAYGRAGVESSGPLYRASRVEGERVRIEFTHAQGLRFGPAGAEGFTAAGADLVFRPAQARIEGEELVVSCPGITAPVAVRYAFEDTSTASLFNAAGLPASTFRTDDARP